MRQRGYTLVELLLVLAMVLVIAVKLAVIWFVVRVILLALAHFGIYVWGAP